MEYFVEPTSVVRKIWGKSDTILFIFAGAAAEFALNKSVDWLYFTGRLPADPLDRLFSTVAYARKIVFSEADEAFKAIDQITAIHKNVEQSRGAKIPDWAYRDVLFMLIDYSIRAYELLERKLTRIEKVEIFNVFLKMGNRMQIEGLPETYGVWLVMRNNHLKNNLAYGALTADLFKQYKKNLGPVRYFLLKQVQRLVVPEYVKNILALSHFPYLWPVLQCYKLSRLVHLHGPVKNLILPKAYKEKIAALDV